MPRAPLAHHEKVAPEPGGFVCRKAALFPLTLPVSPGRGRERREGPKFR
jgi:hypothetical protein